MSGFRLSTKAIIISVIVLFLTGMLFGSIYYRQKLFPIPQLYDFIYGHDKKTAQCPVVEKQKLEELNSISRKANIQRIFWGDSLVERMRDGRFYGISSYQDIGQSGQIVYCALQEIGYILEFKPESVIVYVGGNDADGSSWYGAEEAGKYYQEIIDILLTNNIRPTVHLVHEAGTTRNKTYLKQYNDILTSIAKKNNLLIIPPVSEFSYNQTKEEIKKSGGSLYSYDGEHLTPEGYSIWMQHIGKYVPDFLQESNQSSQ